VAVDPTREYVAFTSAFHLKSLLRVPAFIRLVADWLGFEPLWRRSSELDATGPRSERVLDLLRRVGACTSLTPLTDASACFVLATPLSSRP